MTPLSDVKKLQLVESTVHVEIHGDTTRLEVRACGPGTLFYVNMPTPVWRAFCKRQLSVPPPLPLVKGGAS